MTFHTKARLLWLCAALLPFTVAKNPFYLVPARLVVALDYRVSLTMKESRPFAERLKP